MVAPIVNILNAFSNFGNEVFEWYVDGEKKYDQVTGSENSTFLILEGIFNNTYSNVFKYEV